MIDLVPNRRGIMTIEKTSMPTIIISIFINTFAWVIEEKQFIVVVIDMSILLLGVMDIW